MPQTPSHDGEIVFIHHQPTLPNIGDELCSPRHYFTFEPARARLAIVGGGVFSDFGARRLAQAGLTPSDAVLWGVGRSQRSESQPLALVRDLPHAAWGLRDIDGVADSSRFLPCVSCMHPMLDAPVGRETLLFLNADPRVTSTADVDGLAAIARARGWRWLVNSCTQAELQEALAHSARVLTNSFHGAYWSLLAGREVHVLGYSSKFTSLMRGLGLPADAVGRYARPGRHARLRAILRAWRSAPSPLVQAVSQLPGPHPGLRLDDPSGTRQRFRMLNLTFAQALVSRAIVASTSVRTPAASP